MPKFGYDANGVDYLDSRYLGALILAPLVIFIFIGGEVLKYGVLILSLMGMYEFYRVLKCKNLNPLSYFGYLLCIIYYVNLNNTLNTNFIFYLITAAFMLLLCVPVLNTKYNFIDICVTLLGFLYVAVFFGFIILVNRKVSGQYFIWLIFLSSWLCDTAAYYIGKTFGKNKLCPEISPKKTIEGSVGGLIGSILSCLFFGIYLSSIGINVSLVHYVIIGVLCGVFSQFGDLVASSIKRWAGVKDYSSLIPGHGGILDRFDSILFSSVTVYYYLTFIMGK
ncbi:MAG: hypothetical protein K0R54_3010 [Clostridiaceae bacterium]|jgi:phosphatidate cytidylyltransferase|nr:hypothetical protein [Clostridiaceae bacterium]